MTSILWKPWTVSVAVFHLLLDGFLRTWSFISPFRLGAGLMEEETFASEWDYEGDLELVKLNLAQSTAKDRARMRGTVMTCLDQIQNSELESSILNEPTKRENIVIETFKEDTADNGTNPLNPLEIDLILKNVLRYLSLNSLLNCRLVNRNWNSKAVYWIREKQENPKEIKSEDFPGFCMDFVNCDLFPLPKLEFTLYGLCLDRCGGFFTQHGPRILDLRIMDFKFYIHLYPEETNRENLKRLQHILRNVPNLKYLSLGLLLLPRVLNNSFIFELSKVTLTHVTSWRLYSATLLTTKFLDGFFEMVPNGDDVIIEVNPDDEQQRIALVTSMQKIKFRFRAMFSFPYFDCLGLWSGIINSQRLKHLFVFPEIGDNVEAQEALLKSQSECLELLCLGREDDYNPDPLEDENVQKIKLPVMKNVKRLAFHLDPLSEYYFYWKTFPMIPIEPYQLPNLRTLQVWPSILDVGTFANSAFTSVQNLRIEGYEQNCVQLQRLAALFPNLKKLFNLNTYFGGYQTQLKLIVASWANLEVLEINIVDSLYPAQNFNLLISGFPDLENSTGLASILTFVGPRRPSLHELSHLKKLVLTFRNQYTKKWVRIDEIGVHLTFLRLSPKLKLYFRGNFLIEDKLAALLTAHYQDVYMLPNDTDVS